MAVVEAKLDELPDHMTLEDLPEGWGPDGPMGNGMHDQPNVEDDAAVVEDAVTTPSFNTTMLI